MKIDKKIIILSALTVLLSVLVIFTVVKAGSLTPTGAPGATFYTLDDIYNRLTTGASVTQPTHNFGPSAGPTAGTMHTLTDIYNAIPTNNKILYGTNAGTANTPPGSGTEATQNEILSGYYAFKADGTVIPGSATAAAPDLIWQSDSGLQLCYNASIPNCGAGAGLLDPQGDGTVLLGAVEYCQYLKKDASGPNCSGDPLACTVDTEGTSGQPYWHLPNELELIKGFADRYMPGGIGLSSGFTNGLQYFSSSIDDGGSNYLVSYSSDINRIQCGAYDLVDAEADKEYAANVRCVH